MCLFYKDKLKRRASCQLEVTLCNYKFTNKRISKCYQNSTQLRIQAELCVTTANWFLVLLVLDNNFRFLPNHPSFV